MSLITIKDFDTTAGQARIVEAIHELDSKLRELDKLVHELMHTDEVHEKDLPH